VIVEIYKVSVCLCVLSSGDLFIFVVNFPFLFLFIVYPYFGTFLSTWINELCNTYNVGICLGGFDKTNKDKIDIELWMVIHLALSY
jgi:hypothetical protein